MNTALLLTALATGLAGSAHCIAMCGGIGASLGFAGKRHLPAYHIGRLASYALLGFAFGLILPALGLGTHSLWPRVFAAIIMIATGLCLLFAFHPARYLEKHGQRLWRPVAALTRHFLPVRSTSDALLLGLLWGFLPCGLIYNALALAISSAHPLAAALVMLAFGLGTLPAMLALGYAGNSLALLLKRSRKALACVIITGGLWTLQPLLPHVH